MEQLIAERKRLITIFKDLRDDINIEYNEDNFDIKDLFDSVFNEKRRNIQTKSVQKLGEETISEQQDTANKDAVEQTIEEQERVARNAKDNAQSL